MFPRTSRLTSPGVVLISLSLLLTTQLLMLLGLSKNLFIIILLIGLLISLKHIYYSFILNLIGGFLMMFDLVPLQLVKTKYVSLWTNSLMIFQI